MINGDEKVMKFIHDFITLFGTIQPSESNIVAEVFTKGFCYYFAIILKEAFKCGEIYMTSNDRHIVWVKNNIAYDIGGVYNKYPKSANNANFFNGELIPIALIPNYMESFKHVLPGITRKGMRERDAVDELMRGVGFDV